MIHRPSSISLQKHIDHYWIVTDSQKLFLNEDFLYAYPGITPDMLIVLEGYYTFDYLGKRFKDNKSQLFSFIYDKVFLDPRELKSFIIIRFKSRGLASLQPFLDTTTTELMKNSVSNADAIFGDSINSQVDHLKTLDEEQIVFCLDDWFTKAYKKEREGFVVDLAQQVSSDFNLKEIMTATNYSYSTLERHFKRDTGITPKKYQSLRRFKLAIQELYTTQNSDWMHYVNKFGYFDQSHFIKDIKRYTSFTPEQLLNVPSISTYRPK